MIRLGEFKGRRAVIVETKTQKATFLPDDGAKMSSLVDISTGKELLLVRKEEKYIPLDYNGSYVDSDCSAFDDMFPTIDPYTPSEGEYNGVTYPDHGEICRLPLGFDIEEDRVVFFAESKIFKVTYKKTVYALENGDVKIDYSISNLGDDSFDFIWAGHVMLRGEDGMRLMTSFDENSPREMVFATKGYDQSKLPLDTLIGFKAKTGVAYKFYYLEKIKKGGFSVSYPDGSILGFDYDKDKLPYLGVWINNGEFKDIYNIAPEPCTAPFDSPEKAANKGYYSKIEAKQKFEFDIKISINH